MRKLVLSIAALWAGATACGGNTFTSTGNAATGGSVGTESGGASSGGADSGGSSSAGGSSASSGGAPSGGNGGSIGSGGKASNGGASVGGVPNSSGGRTSSGGTSSGGKGVTGGTMNAAGGTVISAGGTLSAGGAATGGTTSTNLFPTSPVLDHFSRKLLGLNWIGATLNFGVGLNVLGCSSCATPLLWSTPFGVVQEAYVTLSEFDPSSKEINVVLKAQTPGSSCDMVEVVYSPADQSVQVDYCVGNDIWTNSTTVPVKVAVGDQLGGRINADGTLDVFVNGTRVANFDVSAYPYKEGYIGVNGAAADGTAEAFDDFGGGTL